MNMGMSSVGIDRVTRMKTRRNFGTVLVKAVDRNDAGYCLNPGCRIIDLIGQPATRNDTVCVCVGEPDVGKRRCGLCDCVGSGQCSCSPDRTRNCVKNATV